MYPLPYEQPSDKDQLRQARKAARALLECYSLRSPRLTLLHYHQNASFRVNDGDRSRYMLRVQPADPAQIERLSAEVAWLAAIRSDTDLAVSEPIPTKSGALVATAGAGAGGSWVGALFRWMPGRMLGLPIAEGTFGRIGRFTAELHDYGARRAGLLGRCRPVWNWGSLLGAGAPYRSASAARHLTAQQRSLLDEIAALIRPAVESLDDQPGQFGVIHGDLHLGNCLLHGQSVAAIDFEDCGPGYFLMDIATTLREICHPLLSPELYARVSDEYLAAYSKIRPLPADIERQLVVFSTARVVFVGNWLLQLLDLGPAAREYARSLLPEMFADLERHHAALSRAA